MPTPTQPEEKLVCGILDRAALTYGALLSFKSQLRYSARDYFYYKNRCGNDLATYKAIELKQTRLN